MKLGIFRVVLQALENIKRVTNIDERFISNFKDLIPTPTGGFDIKTTAVKAL